MKPLHIYDETFKQNYYVSYGVPFGEYKKRIKRYCNYEITDDENYYAGKCEVYAVKGVQLINVWTRKKDLSVLVHELMHAVYFTLRDRDIKLVDGSEEIYAYLLERLFRNVTKGFKR